MEATESRLLRPLVVFVWLAALTFFELAVVAVLPGDAVRVGLLVGSALGKAALVVLYFMSLRIERRLVRALLAVSVAMVVIFVVALIPDIGMGPPW